VLADPRPDHARNAGVDEERIEDVTLAVGVLQLMGTWAGSGRL